MHDLDQLLNLAVKTGLKPGIIYNLTTKGNKMKITPKSEAELQEEERKRKEESLLPEGIYDFEVQSAEDKVSKIKPDGTGGNPMIVLNFKAFGNDGQSVYVTDYLMEKMAFKLRHACDACGLLKEYESGSLTADMFQDRVGKVKLKIEIGKKKEGSDELYPTKNIVVDYVKSESGGKLAAQVEKDDSIPFS